MDVTVVAIYVVCDEVLKMLEIKDNSQALMRLPKLQLLPSCLAGYLAATIG
jgi:hypothetical protein